MYFDHVAIHVRDFGKKLSAVWATVSGGDVLIQVGFVLEIHRALRAVLGEA